MCLSPILIDNPYYNCGSKGVNYLHDTTSLKIKVPCGSCPQCISMRQGFFNQRIQMESLRSHLFFFTLTYNDESLVYTDCEDYQIPIPVLSDVQNMCKRLRRAGYKFRITYVSEYGTKRHRPHFHGILAVEKSEGSPRVLERKWSRLFRSEWRRNYGSNRSPIWKSLSTDVFHKCRNTTFDFHFIEPVLNHDNDVSFYVSKYITKYDSRTVSLLQKIEIDNSITEEQTKELRSLVKPRCVMSKDFGSWKLPVVQDYIKSCLTRSPMLPQFFDLYTGKSCLLAPYYRRLVPYDQYYEKWLIQSECVDDLSYISDGDKSISDYANSIESAHDLIVKFEKNQLSMKKRFGD